MAYILHLTPHIYFSNKNRTFLLSHLPWLARLAGSVVVVQTRQAERSCLLADRGGRGAERPQGDRVHHRGDAANPAVLLARFHMFRRQRVPRLEIGYINNEDSLFGFDCPT